MKKAKYSFTVGTCAYNEDKNIKKFINAVIKQKLGDKYGIDEIIIVASGCTDETIPIVENLQKKDKRIKLIKQKRREGKVSAVNILLKNVTTKLFILQSADTIPAPSCYRYLLDELVKSNVGLTAGKIVPKDNRNTFFGFANHLRWQLHHDINLRYPQRPKVGELIAFRKIFERIPPKAIVDEASVEPLIHLQGYKIIYVPRAIIYNQGPKSLREYLSRRRSIHAGHYMTKKKYAYEVITFSPKRVIPVFTKNLNFNVKNLVFSFLVVVLEIVAKIFGYFDFKLKTRNQAVWKIASSTKDIRNH